MCGSTVGKNLHSLRDTALVELEEGTPTEIAARIQAGLTDNDGKQWQQGSQRNGRFESLAIVRAQVYRLPPSAEINASYIDRHGL